MIRKILERYPLKTQRFLEILIPATTWGIITLPFWLSFRHPAVVAYFVIGFAIYWFYRSYILGVNGLRSYLKLSAHIRVDWLSEAKKLPNWEKIHHLVIIPEYKEPLSLLRETLSNLTKQDFPHQQISLVLATEKRDPQAGQVSRILKKEFSHDFAHFWVTSHPNIPGEVKGKSSNIAWAGKWVSQKLESLGFDLTKMTVTSCDADSLLHPKYFSYLTWLFLNDQDHDYHFYQAPVMFYNNIWKIPLPGRIINTIGTIFLLAKLSQKERLINFSTYSLSLATVKTVGFWGTDVIPEDYHLFFKTYFKLGEKVSVVPIFLPVLADAAESTSWWRTFINQYEQIKRWAWGVSDDPWVIKNYFLHPEIPFWDKTLKIFHLLEDHIVWPTNWFILILGGSIPPLLNLSFARTVLGHNLFRLSSLILTFCIIFLIFIIILDIRLKPPRPASFPRWKIPLLYFQWITLPVVGFFLSALPGLDAHTRLMLGRRLEYRVTEKIR